MATRTSTDLFLAAGFLFGEGSFIATHAVTIKIVAAQKEREPLAWLQGKFGGSISRWDYSKYGPSRTFGKITHEIYQWKLHGPMAAGLMMALYPIALEMSPRRAGQIRRALATWKATRSNAIKTHCPAGHLLSGANLVRNGNGARCCRACISARGKARKARLRAGLTAASQ